MPFFIVPCPLPFNVVLDGPEAFRAYLIRMDLAALLFHLEGFVFGIHAIYVEFGNGGSSHSGFDQGVDNSTISVSTIALSYGSLFSFESVSVPGESAHDGEHVRRVQNAPSLCLSNGPFNLKAVSYGLELGLDHWIAQRERSMFEDPFGDGFLLRPFSILDPLPR